jgi:glycosyltransferase involved in cell wall biosynthesis
MLKFLNAFFKRKLHYSVIGGWLPSFLDGRVKIEKALKSFEGIYVETLTMHKALGKRGFENVYHVSNFKRIDALPENKLEENFSEPYRLCIFSRIMKQKGVSDAADAVKQVNESLGRCVYELHIYGPVDGNEREWFSALEREFPEYICYKGSVDSYKSVSVLKNYFALLFPTRFFTEGVPGTIIDAYAAGIPIISSKWESFSDVIDDGVTGLSYEFGNKDGLVARLLEVSENPNLLISMKKSCVRKASEFTPEVALGELLSRL